MSHYSEQREADDVWKNAPEGATHHASERFWRKDECDQWSWYRPADDSWIVSVNTPHNYKRMLIRPQHDTKPSAITQEALKPQGPYQRIAIGLDGSKCVLDIYRVLDAFKTDSPALDHAVKKILCPGTRHAKTREQDLREAIASIEAELLLMSQR